VIPELWLECAQLAGGVLVCGRRMLMVDRKRPLPFLPEKFKLI